MTGAYHAPEGYAQEYVQTLRRIESKVDGVDERMRTVETRLARLEARSDAQSAHDEHENEARRWVVGLAISTGLVAGGLIMAIVDRLVGGVAG